jgi:hypothetical protein
VTALKVENFLGSRPVVSDWLLPQAAAVRARNCRLRSGEIAPLVTPQKLVDVPGGARRTFYRVPASPSDYWLSFVDANVDVVEGPLVNDTFDRFYWTGDGAFPKYNTLDRIRNEDGPWTLGIPVPTVAPNVTATSGSDNETRSYVYTWVTGYGEESGPSPPKLITGSPGSAWNVSALVADPGGTARNITKVRIYRTVTGSTTAGAYFFVAEQANTISTYTDNRSNSSVSLGRMLDTQIYGPPPTNLKNLILMPNGFMAGTAGRDIWFSVPYKPHAWPPNYVLSIDADPVALGVIGSTLFILTNSTPYMATGIRPEAISISRIMTVAPCLSKRSVISSPQYGVMYASHNGLVRVTQTGIDLITRDIFDEKDWADFLPGTLTAALDDVNYTAFNGFRTGFILDMSKGHYIELGQPLDFDSIWTDRYSGEAMVAKANRVSLWDPPEGDPTTWLWRSKKFDVPDPINIGAVQVRYNSAVFTNSAKTIASLKAWNAQRIKQPLQPLCSAAIGSSRKVVDPLLDPEIPQNRAPAGGSPLFRSLDLGEIPTNLSFKLYADEELVFERALSEQEPPLRPPEGYKARSYQFELNGNVVVQSVGMAETAHELAAV